MKSLPEGTARTRKHDVGNHCREKERRVDVRKGEGRRGKLPRAWLIGLYISSTDVYCFPILFFLSHAHKHTDLMTADKHKRGLSCRTKQKEEADYEGGIAIPLAIAKGILKAAGKIIAFLHQSSLILKMPYCVNSSVKRKQEGLELALLNCKELRLSRIQVLRRMAE